MTADQLADAESVVNLAHTVVRSGIERVASVDDDQVLAYDVAHAVSAVTAARVMLGYGARGPVEAKLACAFIADAVHDLASRIYGREQLWGVGHGALDAAREFVTAHRAPAEVAAF